jgi:hypothetical protein
MLNGHMECSLGNPNFSTSTSSDAHAMSPPPVPRLIEPLALARALISSHPQLALVHSRRHAIDTFSPCKSESHADVRKAFIMYRIIQGLFRAFCFSFCLRFFALHSSPRTPYFTLAYRHTLPPPSHPSARCRIHRTYRQDLGMPHVERSVMIFQLTDVLC